MSLWNKMLGQPQTFGALCSLPVASIAVRVGLSLNHAVSTTPLFSSPRQCPPPLSLHQSPLSECLLRPQPSSQEFQCIESCLRKWLWSFLKLVWPQVASYTFAMYVLDQQGWTWSKRNRSLSWPSVHKDARYFSFVQQGWRQLIKTCQIFHSKFWGLKYRIWKRVKEVEAERQTMHYTNATVQCRLPNITPKQDIDKTELSLLFTCWVYLLRENATSRET